MQEQWGCLVWWGTPLTPVLGKQGQADFSEFEPTLVYRASSRSVGATKKDAESKTTRTTKYPKNKTKNPRAVGDWSPRWDFQRADPRLSGNWVPWLQASLHGECMRKLAEEVSTHRPAPRGHMGLPCGLLGMRAGGLYGTPM